MSLQIDLRNVRVNLCQRRMRHPTPRSPAEIEHLAGWPSSPQTARRPDRRGFGSASFLVKRMVLRLDPPRLRGMELELEGVAVRRAQIHVDPVVVVALHPTVLDVAVRPRVAPLPQFLEEPSYIVGLPVGLGDVGVAEDVVYARGGLLGGASPPALLPDLYRDRLGGLEAVFEAGHGAREPADNVGQVSRHPQLALCRRTQQLVGEPYDARVHLVSEPRTGSSAGPSG